MKASSHLITQLWEIRFFATFKTFSLTCVAFLIAVLPSRSQSVVIAGQTFHLAYTNSSPEEILQEYLPQDETLKNWTNLFAVRYFKKLDSPQAYITQLNAGYHKKFPDMPFAYGANASSNRWFTDFLAYEKGQKTSEWNFFRADTNATGGILVYQYAERRKYQKSVKELDSWDIKALRKRLVPILRTNEFSVP